MYLTKGGVYEDSHDAYTGHEDGHDSYDAYNGKVFIDQFVKQADALRERRERLPEVIAEGQRNETLSKYAGKVITRLGDTQKAREAFDKAADRCCPPLEDGEANIIRGEQALFPQAQSL